MKPWIRHLVVFLTTTVVVAGVLTPVFLSVYPALILNGAHKVVSTGAGRAQVPDNTLYTLPELASPETANGSTWLLGGNQDGLYTVGWLDLSKGPQVLTIPDMGTRYHNVELVAPRSGVAIANLKAAGLYVIEEPGTSGVTIPSGAQILDVPGKQVLVIGRTLVENDADLPAALALAQQIRVHPLR
jgi:hypothetical protein